MGELSHHTPYYRLAEPELSREELPNDSWQQEMYDKGQRFYGHAMSPSANAALEARIEASKERLRAESEARANSNVHELPVAANVGHVAVEQVVEAEVYQLPSAVA